ncbi:uncharacterized protein LOC117121911 [Anneissia japonica]|uniref:uncharacterized protein LOC117121911 n=1 Tax=Anneissia japonica TaxID=1529436 RepID=UPI0014254BC4|nr:uncharacterized protein LOC117121911 [Anneissia japonica]
MIIDVPGVDTGNHLAVANCINKFLAKNSQKHQANNTNFLPAYLPSHVPPPQSHPWEIYDDLKRVSVSKAGCPDNIPQKIINECAFELSLPVSHIINASLEHGVVPTQWKEANVIPLPKQTPPSIEKVRPISLTPTLAKFVEKRVSKSIIKAIEPFIDSQQYGNQKGVSTTHCLIDVYHKLISEAEKPGTVMSVHLL